ncbi:MAG: succinate dehydrogenase/fumarate reductase flavoprotein subunit, partial [Thermoplasmata archaeon]|nr:succinate dehydrogenase/fumarate reductase flavoprotein subunit [Thermoplasmata archaeon]
MYPKEMEKSVRKVEETRQERLKKLPERMTAEEREALLKKFHPDYRKGAKRKLKVGVSKGNMLPNEVADLIEAYPLIHPDEIDLSQIDYETDILI